MSGDELPPSTSRSPVGEHEADQDDLADNSYVNENIASMNNNYRRKMVGYFFQMHGSAERSKTELGD